MKKLLVVDELNSLTKIYSPLLLNNYQVEASNDANEIVPRLNRFKPHLLIINTDLPELDPTELCKAVKGSFEIPILLLADKNSATTTQIDGCSADEVLTKPFTQAELLNKVKGMLATFS